MFGAFFLGIAGSVTRPVICLPAIGSATLARL